MKIRDKFKKLVTVTLASAMVILSANTLSVHAQSISDVSASQPGYGVVTTKTGSGMNIRTAPDLNASTIASAADGTKLMIIGEAGDFYRVQYDKNGNIGYAHKEFLIFQPTTYYLRANTNSDPLNMRKTGSTSAEVLVKIPKGTSFAFVSYSGDWYQGVFGNITGYTTSQYTGLYRY